MRQTPSASNSNAASRATASERSGIIGPDREQRVRRGAHSCWRSRALRTRAAKGNDYALLAASAAAAMDQERVRLGRLPVRARLARRGARATRRSRLCRVLSAGERRLHRQRLARSRRRSCASDQARSTARQRPDRRRRGGIARHRPGWCRPGARRLGRRCALRRTRRVPRLECHVFAAAQAHRHRRRLRAIARLPAAHPRRHHRRRHRARRRGC